MCHIKSLLVVACATIQYVPFHGTERDNVGPASTNQSISYQEDTQLSYSATHLMVSVKKNKNTVSTDPQRLST